MWCSIMINNIAFTFAFIHYVDWNPDSGACKQYKNNCYKITMYSVLKLYLEKSFNKPL